MTLPDLRAELERLQSELDGRHGSLDLATLLRLKRDVDRLTAAIAEHEQREAALH